MRRFMNYVCDHHINPTSSMTSATLQSRSSPYLASHGTLKGKMICHTNIYLFNYQKWLTCNFSWQLIIIMLITRHDVCMSKSCTLGHKCGLLPSGCTQNLRHNFPHKELLTMVNTFLKFFPLGFFFPICCEYLWTMVHIVKSWTSYECIISQSDLRFRHAEML